MSVKTHDLNNVSCSFLGIPLDGGGYGEDVAFSVDRDVGDFEEKVSADGEVARYATNNTLSKVTITLMQTSVTNSILTAINNLDKAAPNGAGVGPFLLRDANGTFVLAGTGWISGPPKKAEFGKEVKEREWVITVNESVRSDGGS